MVKPTIAVALSLCLYSCTLTKPKETGWEYYDPKSGGFQKVAYFQQETPPGMILVEAGNYSVQKEGGQTDSLVVASFFISKYEETNGQYLAYLGYLRKVYSEATYRKALPDTTVWKGADPNTNICDFLGANYLRNPVYRDFPVVGLTPNQIKKYAAWKGDRINEYILIREGLLVNNKWGADSTKPFTTEGYLTGQYQPRQKDIVIMDIDPIYSGKDKRGQRVFRMEDGILLPPMRLPIADEWHLAHLAIGDSNYRYYNTPKGGKVYGKGIFSNLDDVQRSTGNEYKNATVRPNGLNAVFELADNNYRLCGLNTNVSEIVSDSVSSSIIGGSFQTTSTDNAAIYHDSISHGFRYQLPHALHATKTLDENSTGLYGFRLAMDHALPPWKSNPRRRRYKGR